ncbi:MAG: Gfo/Idh/MocA family oxidoreductase [Proteobacteria bacterium]|nr:Gfo/Idh/MocA family oxidoreductase [Pseudomonadota bacterium]
MNKNFVLIGAAGYVAPRHMKAIAETDNNLVAALDPNDSVGIIDSYFPDADFFTEFERFDRYIEKLKRQEEGRKVGFVSITSPNYLHDAHIRFALRVGADAICEKPLVLNPWNIDALLKLEEETGKKTYNILQLRVHPTIIELKKKIESSPKNRKHDIDLTYITSRGHWYMSSWKNDVSKSGGIASNIGVHFYDMLTWIFGDVEENIVHLSDPRKSAGYLELENARVRWFLSIDCNDLPVDVKEKEQRTYRSIKVDGDEIEFSGGFFDLHTISYQKILEGKGFGLEEARSSIETVQKIRNAKPLGLKGEYHPFLKN